MVVLGRGRVLVMGVCWSVGLCGLKVHAQPEADSCAFSLFLSLSDGVFLAHIYSYILHTIYDIRHSLYYLVYFGIGNWGGGYEQRKKKNILGNFIRILFFIL